jgi:heme exporter protein B
MNLLLELILKDYKVDFRQKYPIGGIVLYILSTIYITYLAFNNLINGVTWNAVFWIIILFVSVTAIAKSFIQENDRSTYYYYLISPQKLLMGKILYHTVYELLIVALTYIVFVILMGNPLELNGWFFLNLFLGVWGFALAFTLISSLAVHTGNQSTMMAILGFPVVIPILILAVNNSRKIILGMSFEAFSGNLIALFFVIVIIIALSFILFPYSWRN